MWRSCPGFTRLTRTRNDRLHQVGRCANSSVMSRSQALLERLIHNCDGSNLLPAQLIRILANDLVQRLARTHHGGNLGRISVVVAAKVDGIALGCVQFLKDLLFVAR